MDNKSPTTLSKNLDIMDVVNISYIIFLSFKNVVIFIMIFFLMLGFLQTAKIEPQYQSKSRLLIELTNINLKDEQNIDFSSLNNQAIQTEIEKIKSNTLLHNVILKNNISIPQFKISENNSSKITYLANKFLSYSGLRFVLDFFEGAASSVAQKAIETTLDVALDTVITTVDADKISDVSNKIKNEFKLTNDQNKKLVEIQEKFQNEKPNTDEVMSFAYGVLRNNDYSNQDIIELARNYLPDSVSLSDEMLEKLIEKYKG